MVARERKAQDRGAMDPVTLATVALELLLVTAVAGGAAMREELSWSRLERVASRLPMVAVLILGAFWDGVVTEEERYLVADAPRGARNRAVADLEVAKVR